MELRKNGMEGGSFPEAQAAQRLLCNAETITHLFKTETLYKRSNKTRVIKKTSPDKKRTH